MIRLYQMLENFICLGEALAEALNALDAYPVQRPIRLESINDNLAVVLSSIIQKFCPVIHFGCVDSMRF